MYTLLQQSELLIVSNRLKILFALVGSSPALANVWAVIERVCDTDATVLITGESGVGKEVVADEIYSRSLRRDKPIYKVNCASIPANLLESELFGYEKGSFSGANTTRKKGLFEMANNGTLLLDEIGDMQWIFKSSF